MGIFSKNPRISFPVNMSPKVVVSTIKKMKNVQISNQGTVLKLQEDLLKDKNEQLRSIHSAKLKKSNAVFKTFVREEERQKNVISLN